jgi:uncharacterized coiled-coil protein SlyX
MKKIILILMFVIMSFNVFGILTYNIIGESDPIATPRIDSLNLTKLNIVDQRYNDTVLINTKLTTTDQRYNDTALIYLVNDSLYIELGNYLKYATNINLNGYNLTANYLYGKVNWSQLYGTPTFTNGTNGIDGINGTNGIDGINGTNGIDGVNGTNGINGINGTNGINGINGTNGIDGVNGTNGIDGINGTNGIDGINGTNGINGINGTNGIDGINGTNGIDGINGTFLGYFNTTQIYNLSNLYIINESWIISLDDDSYLLNASDQRYNDTAEITELNTTLSLQIGRIDTLNSTLITQTGRIDTLNSTLITQTGRIDTLNSTLITQNGRIDILNSTLVTQTDRIDSLNSTKADINNPTFTGNVTATNLNITNILNINGENGSVTFNGGLSGGISYNSTDVCLISNQNASGHRNIFCVRGFN